MTSAFLVPAGATSIVDVVRIDNVDEALKPARTTPAAEAFQAAVLAVHFPGAVVPIEVVDDERIVLSAIDRLLQQMCRWRAHRAPAVDLLLPPRAEPEGWWTESGLISPRPQPVVRCPGFDPLGFVVYEYYSEPQWLVEERAARRRPA